MATAYRSPSPPVKPLRQLTPEEEMRLLLAAPYLPNDRALRVFQVTMLVTWIALGIACVVATCVDPTFTSVVHAAKWLYLAGAGIVLYIGWRRRIARLRREGYDLSSVMSILEEARKRSTWR